MKLICPVCEKEVDVKPVTTVRKVKVYDEQFSVPVKLYKCLECGYDQIEDHSDPQDEIAIAFNLYREKHGLILPEELVDFRKNANISQEELANLLGVDVAIIDKYENGGLPSDKNTAFLFFYDNLIAVFA